MLIVNPPPPPDAACAAWAAGTTYSPLWTIASMSSGTQPPLSKDASGAKAAISAYIAAPAAGANKGPMIGIAAVDAMAFAAPTAAAPMTSATSTAEAVTLPMIRLMTQDSAIFTKA